MNLHADFLSIIRTDPSLSQMLRVMHGFNAPDFWLVSGALFQTVWNVLEGRKRGYGINDYDLFYFDPDLSKTAEDAWIKKAAVHFAFADHEVQLRNQARVHLWYPQKFNVSYPQLKSACEGIDRFLVQASVVAVRPTSATTLEVYAPLGLEDIFNRILRPNPLWKGPARKEYQIKCERYMRDWPSLRMM